MNNCSFFLFFFRSRVSNIYDEKKKKKFTSNLTAILPKITSLNATRIILRVDCNCRIADRRTVLHITRIRVVTGISRIG